jgi:hypothetical protein
MRSARRYRCRASEKAIESDEHAKQLRLLASAHTDPVVIPP